MKIRNDLHLKQPWRVHELTGDFLLEDVWQFPIEAAPESAQNFELFREVFKKAMEDIKDTGPAGALFRFRMWLGKLFNWDSAQSATPVFNKDSLLHRYCSGTHPEGAADRDAAPAGDQGGFHPVYAIERETLSEIANKTVHAALHLSWVPLETGQYTARLAVYVKILHPFTRWYMLLIKPFRLWIVYPTMMRRTGKLWRQAASTA